MSDDLSVALAELKRPFTAAAIRIKPQSVTKDKTKGLVTYYIDARLVSERLNASVGAGGWEDRYQALSVGQEALAVGIPVECYLTVLGVTKADVGQIAPGERDDKMWKSAYSDAFKRAAVKFGVGAYLYGGPQTWVPVDVYNDKVKGFSDAGRKQAMDVYTKWIGSPAFVSLWGEPLDHGDVAHEPAPLFETHEFNQAAELVVGAPAGKTYVQDGMRLLTDAAPWVDWPNIVSQAIRGCFGVEESRLIPPDRKPEFPYRYANMCARIVGKVDVNTVPPVSDADIVEAVAWAFDGAVVEVVRVNSDQPKFGES